ncbi:hypothetical protein [Roseateles sp.]|uniref:hypothetical protein n=1 Tax=Roseateles sp. TaxID=1971397 RepID=UPI0039481A40
MKALLALVFVAASAQAGEFFDDFEQPDLATLRPRAGSCARASATPALPARALGASSCRSATACCVLH